MNPIVVIGLGHPLMSDEGVGGRVAAELARRGPPGVDVIDLGTGGMDLLHAIANRRKAVLVDCAKMGEPPGTLRRFMPAEVRSVKALSGFSIHEGDLLEVLALSRRLGELPEEVVIFGIEPSALTPGETLSPELAARLDGYVSAVLAEIGG